MNNHIDTIIRRTQGYWYVDGLNEIAVGLLLMIMSVYFLLQSRITGTSAGSVLANIALFAAVLVLFWFSRRAVQAVKARMTYPRSGFVAYPAGQAGPRRLRYIFAAAIGLVCVLLVALVPNSQNIHTWIPLLIGLISGLVVLYLSYRFRLLRLSLLAGALVLTGIVISLFNPSQGLAELLTSFIDGIWFVISGGITLFRYLHGTVPPAGESI